MNTEAQSGFQVENSFFSSRGWHLEFADSATAAACYQQLMDESGWGLREVARRPATLEGTQVIFKTPRAQKIEVLAKATTL
jgi:hypothetical protein